MKSDEILALILGGGKGSRMYPLTKYRSKPAVPIAGKFRIIDIPISNCINSDIHKMYVLTQFNTHSLHRHIYDTYRFGTFSPGFVDILSAQQTLDNMDWYQGTADAVRQNIWAIENIKPRYTLILSGDHLYRMDYRKFLRTHIANKADITISVKPVSAAEAPGFGILQTDKNGRIQRFIEKPTADLLPTLCSPGLPEATPYLASMGIYMFSTNVLYQVLAENLSDDFGRHIIPTAIRELHVYAHNFHGYWKDIGTIGSFFESNLELASIHPPFTFYDQNAPFYTRPRFLPGARFEDCCLMNTLVGDGCYIRKSTITRAVIGIRTLIGAGSRIERAVVLGADFYEAKFSRGVPAIGIGRNCVIQNAIIDKNARIGNNVHIVNQAGRMEFEDENYSIRDGIVVVPKNAILPNGTEI